jgi:hypothetical protein
MPRKDKDKAGAQLTHRGAGAVRKALGGTKKRLSKVPGPSTNPATNILIADLGMRAASRLFRRTMEKGLLRLKFPPEKAHEIIEGRSLGQSLVIAGLARVATRSVPGALLVTGGLIAKSILDRSLSRRESVRRGTRELEEQAENAD